MTNEQVARDPQLFLALTYRRRRPKTQSDNIRGTLGALFAQSLLSETARRQSPNKQRSGIVISEMLYATLRLFELGERPMVQHVYETCALHLRVDAAMAEWADGGWLRRADLHLLFDQPRSTTAHVLTGLIDIGVLETRPARYVTKKGGRAELVRPTELGEKFFKMLNLIKADPDKAAELLENNAWEAETLRTVAQYFDLCCSTEEIFKPSKNSEIFFNKGAGLRVVVERKSFTKIVRLSFGSGVNMEIALHDHVANWRSYSLPFFRILQKYIAVIFSAIGIESIFARSRSELNLIRKGDIQLSSQRFEDMSREGIVEFLQKEADLFESEVRQWLLSLDVELAIEKNDGSQMINLPPLRG